MIPITETIITMNQAAKLLPRRRAGRSAHVATLYRWARHGCRGVTLETVQVGGTLCTSQQALERFFARLGDQPMPRRPDRRRLEAAQARLAAAGW